MRIQHNITALTAANKLKANESAVSKNIQKLSSGYRINSAADDAAGLAVSEKMRRQINGLDQAQDNTKNAISLVQTAEGGLNETSSILQRMNTLAVESANGIYDDQNDRANLDLESSKLKDEINKIADNTTFNGVSLLNNVSTSLTFQVGSEQGITLQYTLGSVTQMNTTGLAITGVSIATQTAASAAITTITAAINIVNTARANLGALQNELEHTANNLGTESENLSSAESTIRDVDMSDEYVQFSKNQILTQAANAMLAQANTQPQDVLTLLKG